MFLDRDIHDMHILLSFHFVVCVRLSVRVFVTEYDHCGVLGTVCEICTCTDI